MPTGIGVPAVLVAVADRGHRARAIVEDVGGLAIRGEHDGTGVIAHRDWRASGVGGGRGSGSPSRGGAGDVGGLAVRGERDGIGVRSTGIGVPAVLVAVVMGVTVSEL